MAIQKPIEKRYFSIKQVSEMLDVEIRQLKQWEDHFSQLRPKRNKGGNRLYRQNDIQTLFLIKDLVITQGYSPESAQEKMRLAHSRARADEYLKLRRLLGEIKLEINEIKELLDGE